MPIPPSAFQTTPEPPDCPWDGRLPRPRGRPGPQAVRFWLPPCPRRPALAAAAGLSCPTSAPPPSDDTRCLFRLSIKFEGRRAVVSTGRRSMRSIQGGPWGAASAKARARGRRRGGEWEEGACFQPRTSRPPVQARCNGFRPLRPGARFQYRWKRSTHARMERRITRPRRKRRQWRGRGHGKRSEIARDEGVRWACVMRGRRAPGRFRWSGWGPPANDGRGTEPSRTACMQCMGLGPGRRPTPRRIACWWNASGRVDWSGQQLGPRCCWTTPRPAGSNNQQPTPPEHNTGFGRV